MTKISAVITTYNHEKYIEQCLVSVLEQRGDFQIEIIVGDDCSTDNTRKIIEDFRTNNSKDIIILPREKNLGITKNLKRCLDACSGDYIAICEGDDYWIDEYKLQKQMEFLEVHEDYSMCFSGILILWEGENKLAPFSEQKALNKISITVEELIDVNYIGNFSCCMYRTVSIRKLSSEIFDVFTVDWMFNLACGTLGKIGFIKEWMSVYRKHSAGVWSGKSNLEQVEEMLPRVDTYNKLLEYKFDNEFMKYKEKLKSIKAHYQANH